jgi:hypothetical protein
MNFLDKSPKESQTSNVVKTRPVGAKLFHADGKTDGRTEGQTDDITKVSFHNYANAIKNTNVMHANAEFWKVKLAVNIVIAMI